MVVEGEGQRDFETLDDGERCRIAKGEVLVLVFFDDRPGLFLILNRNPLITDDLALTNRFADLHGLAMESGKIGVRLGKNQIGGDDESSLPEDILMPRGSHFMFGIVPVVEGNPGGGIVEDRFRKGHRELR